MFTSPVPQFAPVAPLPTLRALDDFGALGHYQLLIAPIVLQHEYDYHLFFNEEHHDQFVILDNGVIEQGEALSGFDLYRAAEVCGAHLVVMPDTIDDGATTVEQTARGLEAFRKYDKATDTLGVVQGTTMEECLQCAEQLVELGVDWLSVPRGLTRYFGTRVELAQHLVKYELPIHILGFSENMEDDIRTVAAHPLIRGMDAATPVWLSQQLPPTPPQVAGYGRRPMDFWDWKKPRGLDLGLAKSNVETVRAWINRAWHDQSGAPAARTSEVEQ